MNEETISLTQLNEEQLKELYSFMKPIWYDTYSFLPVIQIDLLLNKYFTFENICKFKENGYEYYSVNGVGVLVVKEQEDSLYIDKLYLLDSERGKNYPQKVFDWLLKRGKSLTLNVNRNNARAVKCYLKNGFKIVKEMQIDLGSGLVNCDYFMKKEI